MKKIILKSFLVGLCTFLMFSMKSFAEETTETNVTIETNEVMDSLSIVKSDIKNIIEDMQKNDRISENEMNDMLSRLENVVTIEEAENILSEAWTISNAQNLSIAKSDIKNIIEDMQKNGRISGSEMNDMLSRLETAATTEEAENILSEAWAISNAQNLSILKSRRENEIKDLQKDNLITVDQMNEYLLKIQKATTEEEIEKIWIEAKEFFEQQPKNTSGNSESKEQENKNSTASSNKESLPKTGENSSGILMILGLIILLSFIFLYVKSKLKTK